MGDFYEASRNYYTIGLISGECHKQCGIRRIDLILGTLLPKPTVALRLISSAPYGRHSWVLRI